VKSKNPIITTLRQAKRLVIAVIGFTVLVFGGLLAIPGIPGPGILIIILGLAILATEFIWARKLYRRFKEGAHNIKNSILNNPKKNQGESRNKQLKF